MRGRKPKDPKIRQRQNKASTAAVLKPPTELTKRTPPLPRGFQWHAQARQWWRNAWRSPMAQEWLETDKDVLERVVVLVNDFWNRPSEKLALAIDKLSQELGLTPMARQRLHWKVEHGTAEPPPQTAKEMLDEGKDPRDALRAV